MYVYIYMGRGERPHDLVPPPQRVLQHLRAFGVRGYRGTSLIRNTHPPKITIGPQA